VTQQTPPPAPKPPSTTTTQHGVPPRGLALIPGSTFYEGRFGRMFRSLPVFEHPRDELVGIANQMLEAAEAPGADDDTDLLDNPKIPAGYTYFGQFIDHDITFDPVSDLQRQNDPDALHDFRTPRFDLDSLYGSGSADQPYLYNHPPLAGQPAGRDRGTRLNLGTDVGNGRDLVRNQDGRALIGDPRNDENLIVSQLQVLFIRFHNKVVDHLLATTDFAGDTLLKVAQRIVRWHYQWIVVHDFLGHVVGKGVVDDILRTEKYRVAGHDVTIVRPRLLFYRWKEQPFMPVEFSVAAYRFGHSMIRDDYVINNVVPRVPIFSDDLNPLANLNGFRPLPQQWGFDWSFFFQLGAAPTPNHPQFSHKIDTKLARPLLTLPGVDAPRSLAERNLLRGLAFDLPTGQVVARAMGIEPLSDAQLGLGAFPSCKGRAPLWFYVLKEAETLQAGARLGPVGGRIVAEVLIGLLVGDPLSYVNVAPNWHPKAPFTTTTDFGMPELIKFVG
jgi:hypothetical protein